MASCGGIFDLPNLTARLEELDGIPEGSRAASEGSLDRGMLAEETLERLRGLAAIAERRGQSLAQLALAWALRDERVTSLVIGILAGAAGQALLQLPGLRGTAFRLSFDLSHPGVRRIVRLYLPVAGGLVVSAAVVALDTRLASTAGEGALAAMRYATTLIQLPLGLVATALSFAILPVLSRYERWRRFDTFEMGATTDVLNRLFSNDNPALRIVRDVGLGLVDRLPALKRMFIREAAGSGGELPRLLRGEGI